MSNHSMACMFHSRVINIVKLSDQDWRMSMREYEIANSVKDFPNYEEDNNTTKQN